MIMRHMIHLLAGLVPDPDPLPDGSFPIGISGAASDGSKAGV